MVHGVSTLVSITDGGSDAELETHITGLFHEDTALQSAAVVYFRQLVSPQQTSTQVYLCERHVIDRLADILRQSDLLSLLRDAAQTLSVLILASDFVADAAVSGGAVPVLIAMVHQSTDAGLCLHALFLPALPILNDLFDSQRDDTLANVFHAFAAIMDKSDVARIEAVRRLGVLPRIIQCLYATEAPDLQQNALKKVEEELVMLLQHPNAVVQADALLDPLQSPHGSRGQRAAPAGRRRFVRVCTVLRDVEDDDVDEQMVSLALEGVDILLTKLQQPPVDDEAALFATLRTRLSDPENGIVLDLTDLIQYCEVVEVQQR
eukprot:gene14799-10586_t